MKRITEAALLVVFCMLLYLPGLTTIPPLDRDEARFAQASKQMLETGDLVDIRFQDKPRYKKPAGTYWLQAASSAMLRPIVGDQIWTYRLPSVLAAVLAVLLTMEIGRLLFNRRCGLIAGGLLAGSVLLVAEAHQAKSDAVLLVTILLMFWPLARLYPAAGAAVQDSASPPAWPRWVFWAGLGASIMVKGPIGLLVVGLFLTTLTLLERRLAWLRALVYWPAIVLAVVIALPWYVAITIASDGAFLAQAIGRDLAPKLAGGVEAHGAWPGYYTMLTLLMAWPASLFLWPTLLGWRQAWSIPAVKFMIAWALPSLLVFELIPTKLPHYVLPVYPALMLITAAAVSGAVGPLADTLRGRPAKIWAFIWALIGLVLGIAGGVVMVRFGGDGGPAMAAQLSRPHSLQFSPTGDLYICDIGNHRVRKVTTLTGTITTIAGNGAKQMPEDGDPFASAPLHGPRALDFDANGDLWLALREGNTVYQFDMDTGILHHRAGTGEKGFGGHGGPAKDATLSGPKGLSIGPAGRVYLADTESHSVRMLDPFTTHLELIAGNGSKGDGPDGQALLCKMDRLHGIFVGGDGSIYVGDTNTHRVRVFQ